MDYKAELDQRFKEQIELRQMGIAAIFLLCAVFCNAQNYDTLKTLTFTGTSVEPKKDDTKWKDTVIVVLLVCDTTHYINNVFWLKAYSVREGEYRYVDVSINPNTSTYLGGGVYSTTLLGWLPVWEKRAFYTHLEYLDDKKLPLSKNVIVWQSVSK